MRVLLFDVFGTLVDWRSSLIDIAVTTGARDGLQADWAGIIDDWRRAYQPALDQARQDAAWRDLDAVQHETLNQTLERYAVPLAATGRDTLRCWAAE